MKLDLKIDGAKELDALLKQLPTNVASRVTTGALRAGARLIRDEAKGQIQRSSDTGELRKSIKVLGGPKQRGKRTVYVGVFGKHSPLAHIVEFGTVAHKIATKSKRVLADAGNGLFFGRTVNHPGQKAAPFLRPAADVKMREAVDTIGRALADGITKEAQKLGKRR